MMKKIRLKNKSYTMWVIMILMISFFVTQGSAEERGLDAGKASVTQGPAQAISKNLYSHTKARVAMIGSIKAQDGTEWIVPAETEFQNDEMPFAPSLYDEKGKKFRSAQEAMSSFDVQDVITIDKSGELITAYVFADNYFELYINGVPIGKDNVPFTPFNSNVMKFRVSKPFTIAMKLVDWEENLGVGTENNRGAQHHPGDGGMVAVFADTENNIIAVTNEDWKAITLYTAPVKDLSCVKEKGMMRNSDACDTRGSNNGSKYYALHWAEPTEWKSPQFDDSAWPMATTYTNAVIGVKNKKAYTQFTDVFDNRKQDAEFIWSSNVILDNEVLVRYTVR